MEEMLDTYTENRKRTGRAETRSFCHGKNVDVYHKAVWVWIVNEKGEILVQKRSKLKKKNPDKWDISVAGHVLSGETYKDACVREVFEEIGVLTRAQDFRFYKELKRKEAKEFSRVYVLKTTAKLEDLKYQVKEVATCKFLSFDKFKKLLFSEDFCGHSDESKKVFIEILSRYVGV